MGARLGVWAPSVCGPYLTLHVWMRSPREKVLGKMGRNRVWLSLRNPIIYGLGTQETRYGQRDSAKPKVAIWSESKAGAWEQEAEWAGKTWP